MSTHAITTLVTVAGFMPVGFAKSIAGQYAGGIFWVVAIALVASWFVAVIFTPYIGVKLLPNLAHHANHDPHAVYETRMYRGLRAIVQWCVDHRIKVVAATIGIFALSIVGFGHVQRPGGDEEGLEVGDVVVGQVRVARIHADLQVEGGGSSQGGILFRRDQAPVRREGRDHSFALEHHPVGSVRSMNTDTLVLVLIDSQVACVGVRNLCYIRAERVGYVEGVGHDHGVVWSAVAPEPGSLANELGGDEVARDLVGMRGR